MTGGATASGEPDTGGVAVFGFFGLTGFLVPTRTREGSPTYDERHVLSYSSLPSAS